VPASSATASHRRRRRRHHESAATRRVQQEQSRNLSFLGSHRSYRNRTARDGPPQRASHRVCGCAGRGRRRWRREITLSGSPVCVAALPTVTLVVVVGFSRPSGPSPPRLAVAWCRRMNHHRDDDVSDDGAWTPPPQAPPTRAAATPATTLPYEKALGRPRYEIPIRNRRQGESPVRSKTRSEAKGGSGSCQGRRRRRAACC
jgi:hypothetical protein